CRAAQVSISEPILPESFLRFRACGFIRFLFLPINSERSEVKLKLFPPFTLKKADCSENAVLYRFLNSNAPLDVSCFERICIFVFERTSPRIISKKPVEDSLRT